MPQKYVFLPFPHFFFLVSANRTNFASKKNPG